MSGKKKFIKETKNERIVENIMKMYTKGWPITKKLVPENKTLYFSLRNELHVLNGLVVLDEKLIVAIILKKKILENSTVCISVSMKLKQETEKYFTGSI